MVSDYLSIAYLELYYLKTMLIRIIRTTAPCIEYIGNLTCSIAASLSGKVISAKSTHDVVYVYTYYLHTIQYFLKYQ